MTDRSSNKLLAFVVALLTLMALAVPLIGTAAANHPTGSCLDVDPESETNMVGETHEVTATLRMRDVTQAEPDDACNGAPVTATNGPVNIDFRIEGPHDPNPQNTSGTADYSCDIPEGSSSCSFIYTGTATGTDLIRGWVDHDRIQTTIEADSTEGPNDVTEPGAGDQCSFPARPAEPDCTDVVEKTWNAGPAAMVDCDDAGPPNSEREVNPSNEGSASNETYTCTVTDAQGNPVGGAQVYGEVENGINDPDATDGASYSSPDYGCTTASSGAGQGTCTVVVTQNEGETGTAEICFWTGTPAEGGDAAHCGTEPTEEGQNPDGSDSPNDAADQVEKSWEQRRASAIDAEPESDTNNPGEDHTITATVYDQFGQPFRGTTKIDFEFFQGSPSDADGNTPASPDRSCTTNDSNTCSITYTSQQSGTDLVCVYPDTSRPNMVGNNTNGTCDGEGLTDVDDDPARPDAPERDANDRVSDDQDVVQKRWAAPGEATRLDCNPETDSNPTGTSHTITCTARNQSGNPVGGVNIDAEAVGANDPDGNVNTTSPDFTCTTDSTGTCSFTHGPGGTGTTNNPGTTTYGAWIDSDNNNATSEADQAEARDETTTPGNEAEPDNTDVVTKTWVADARTIDCEPETATNSVGTTHTVTCTVRDRAGNPVSGESVTFTETGAGQISGSSTDTTDQNGQATVTTTSNETGEQSITGTLTDDTGTNEPNEVDECDRAANDPQGAPAGACSDTVQKTWVGSRGRTIDCSPETANNPTGTQHVVTCVVRDASGQTVAGEGVTFTEEGPGAITPTQATTDQNGAARTTATSSQTGTQTITGTITADTQGAEPGEVDECDRAANDPQGAGAGVCADSVTKTWEQGQQPPQCSDDVDNDNDNRIDENDPGCRDANGNYNPNDNDERDPGQGPTRGPCQGFPFDSRTPKADGDGMVIVGTPDNDILIGTDGDDTICALGGDDQVDALEGQDQVAGNGGADEIDGGRGKDQLKGGRGRDIISGRGGNDVISGGAGNDTLKGNKGIDSIRGEDGNDTIQGGSHQDTLVGGAGADVLRGWTGDDVIKGGGGHDIINGHRGFDICRGGRGNNSIRNCEE